MARKTNIRWEIIRRAPLLVAELLLKRGLSTVLSIAWRMHLNPFAFLSGRADTPGRFYIQQFLVQYAAGCRGRFLEFGDRRYHGLFAPIVIERYDIIDVARAPGVTIVADIQHCPAILDNTYDVIICTQVLEHVANPFLAAAELFRILKPGGRLLLTVPAAYPYHAVPRDYWRFTRDSLQLLFGERFRDLQIAPWGNRVTVVAAYWFWAHYHVPQHVLTQIDPDNPQILSVCARK